MKINYKKINKYLIIGFIILIIVIGLLIYYYKSNKNKYKKQIEIFSDTQDLIVPDWNQLGGDIDGEAKNDWSGYSVSLSSDGKTVAIGAPYNDGNDGNDGNYSNSGHVRVYEYDETNNEWTQLGGDIDGESANDESEYSISLSSDGKIVAIGANGTYGNGDDNYYNSGHVRVYQYDETKNEWTQLGNDIYGEDTNDEIRISVSLSSDGKIVAIGVIENNNDNDESSCYVRVYQYDESDNEYKWNKLGGDIYGEAADDESGYSVSLSFDGKIVAIGARKNSGNGYNSGHVRVYEYDDNKTTTDELEPVGWTQLGEDIDGESIVDYSGNSVSLSSDGKIVAIGAMYNDGDVDDNYYNSGHVRVYKFDDDKNEWTQLGGDIDGEKAYDKSGWAVSLSSDGKIVAIGSYKNYGENGSDSGHVRVYKFDNNKWTQLGNDIDGEASQDKSGYSVSLSSDETNGTIVAIGAYGNDGNGSSSGHVRVYKFNTNTQTSTTSPQTTSPSTTKPSTTSPQTTQPSTTSPSTTSPSTTKPSTTSPSTTSPQTTKPSTTSPNLYVSPMEQKGYNGQSVYISNMDGITSTFLPSIKL